MPHTHFCKRKKEKKESRLALWRVSKKQVLRIKYYPTEEYSVVSLQWTVNWNVEGGDFIRNRRLELAFLNTRNKPLASFLSFFCKNVSYLSFGTGSSSKGVVTC
jgi:hypothetical protein